MHASVKPRTAGALATVDGKAPDAWRKLTQKCPAGHPSLCSNLVVNAATARNFV